MSRIPKWLGDTMEVVFSKMIHPVEVLSVKNIAPALKSIVMEGNFTGVKFKAGNVIEFRINSKEYRHYTASRFDTEKGICEMLIYLHGHGDGSKWIDNLQVGDSLKLMGPGGKIAYLDDREHHFIFGDETSLGLLLSIQEEANRKGHRHFGLAELEEKHKDWPALLGVSAEVVPKSFEHPAAPAWDKLESMEDEFWAQWQEAAFYLTGRAKSIQAVRKVLIAHGISMKQIKTEPYWAERKKGL